MAQDVIRNFEVIGEAVKRIPESMKKRPDIPGARIAGLRCLDPPVSRVDLEAVGL